MAGEIALDRKYRLLTVMLLVPILLIVVWQLAYGAPADPRDLRYQAWKLGIYPMNPDLAVEYMVRDLHHDTLVLGKTKQQLINKFGFVSSIESDPHAKLCYDNSPWHGKDAFMLRHSWWMVVMDRGVAVDLVILKGC